MSVIRRCIPGPVGTIAKHVRLAPPGSEAWRRWPALAGPASGGLDELLSSRHPPGRYKPAARAGVVLSSGGAQPRWNTKRLDQKTSAHPRTPSGCPDRQATLLSQRSIVPRAGDIAVPFLHCVGTAKLSRLTNQPRSEGKRAKPSPRHLTRCGYDLQEIMLFWKTAGISPPRKHAR